MEPVAVAGNAPAKVTLATVPDTVRRLNAAFRTGKTRNIAWRRSQLERLRYVATCIV